MQESFTVGVGRYWPNLGNGSASSANVTIPEKIGTSNSWSQIAVGYSHTCGINGRALLLGVGRYWPNRKRSASSADVTLPEKLAHLILGCRLLWAIPTPGGSMQESFTVRGWDVTGQIGIRKCISADVTLPEKIGTSNSWSQIALGDFHTCGIMRESFTVGGRTFMAKIGNGSASSADVTP